MSAHGRQTTRSNSDLSRPHTIPDPNLWRSRGRRPPVDWTRHHLIPRSRGGLTERVNLARVDRYLHRAWHVIFSNMTPEEAMIHIAAFWAPTGYFTEISLRSERGRLDLTDRDIRWHRTSFGHRWQYPAFPGHRPPNGLHLAPASGYDRQTDRPNRSQMRGIGIRRR